jgi:hypothetical protein
LHSDCCGAADETGVAADDAPWDPDADADDPGPDADEPALVCPGPALLAVALGPVGASVVLKNGPCVREVEITLVRVWIVVFKDVWVMVDVLNRFEDA